MKRFISVILFVVMLACVFTGCGEKSDIPEGYKLASNESCDFDFYVPQNWTVSLSSGTVSANTNAMRDSTSISVMPGSLSSGITSLDEWWKSYVPEFQRVFGEMSEVTVTDCTLDGVEGKCYTFTASLGDPAAETAETTEGTASADKPTVYYYEITAVIHHSRIYMMTFTSTDELYENHTDTLAEVKEYFKFH